MSMFASAHSSREQIIGAAAPRRRDLSPKCLCLDESVTSPWDDDFQPSAGARSAMRWAYEHGASTLGEAYDMLDQLDISNDVPEILGHDDTVDGVRAELDLGVELAGADAALTELF